MKIHSCIVGAAFAAMSVATTAPFLLSAAPVNLLDREQGRLSAMPQKSFEDLRDLTDRRIAEIRATPNMSISSGEVVRYVSANGDDTKDGKTEATAWKTLGKLTSGNLKPWFQTPVNCVRFRRGDVFRGQLQAVSGVTYTAYGTGPKPCIYASTANGANTSKWKQTDAPNVWKYYAGMADVGTIVFDGGRSHAIKIVPERHTNATDTVKFTQLYTGEPFTNSYKDLAHDLHFWHDYTTNTWFKKYAKGDGYLYLYSSKGNPGSRFKSIEFCTGNHAIKVDVTSDVTIDNLCIKYVGAHGIGAGSNTDPTLVKNLKVTNCEFGWIGGSVQSEYSNVRNYPIRYGNAVEIYGGCDGYTVENCYIYQVYDAGITHQFDLNNNVTKTKQKNIRYANNVIECCNYSIEYFLMRGKQPNDTTSQMENVSIVSNIMWDAGTGFCEQRPITYEAAHIKSWQLDNRAKNFSIRDNVFARSKVMLLQVNATLKNTDGNDSMPTMTGNLFIGDYGQRFGVANQGSAVSLKYDDDGISKLCESFANNYFLITPRRKYSLSVAPPGPQLGK